MIDVPFDLADPPLEPPSAASGQRMLWRVARRLFDDHSPDPTPRCRTCGEPWPCFPRRLAERGLVVACRTAQPRPRVRPDWTRLDLERDS